MKNQQTNPTENKGTNPKSNNKGNGNRRFHKHRSPRNFWKTLITNKLFDLVIVVLGVSIAFFLNNLRDDVTKANTEKFYLQNFAGDLDRDIAKLTENRDELKADYDILVTYIEQFGSGEAVGDSLASVVAAILSVDTFEGSNNTYMSLINEDGLSVISDKSLRFAITEYYNEYKSITRFEEVYTKVIFEINAYFGPNMDYTLRKVSNRGILSSNQTKNSLLLTAGQLETGIENYESALSMAKSLREKL